MNTYVETDYFTSDDVFVTAEENFRVAVTLEDCWTSEFKNDPRYVKWFARYSTFENGKTINHEIPMNPCTEEDYEKFYPVG